MEAVTFLRICEYVKCIEKKVKFLFDSCFWTIFSKKSYCYLDHVRTE